MPEWLVHFDGLAEPRYSERRFCTYGFVAWHGDALVHEAHGVAAPPGPGATSNFAEYAALMHALTWLKAQPVGDCPVRVRGDSLLVVRQVRGEWRVHSEELKPLVAHARGLLAELPTAEIEWVPRAQNEHADRLTRLAYHEAKLAHPDWVTPARR